MDKKPSITRLIKARSYLRKHQNKKFVSLDMLSRGVGVYSDVLGEDLVLFAPLIFMDSSINMHDLLPEIEKYLEEEALEKSSKPKIKRQTARKKELSEYKNYVDFIYQKMAGPGGLISPTAELNDHDLYLLFSLIKKERQSRNKKSKKSAKK